MGRKRRSLARALSSLIAGCSVLTAVVLAGALAVTADPAYADVTSSDYSIGTPPASVSASPGTVTPGGSTNFEVAIIPATALVGSADDSITITSSEALGSAPTNVALISTSCGQAGTAGAAGAGSTAPSGLTIELGRSCNISATSNVEVDFTANAPGTTGTLTFAVTTSTDSTPVTSNPVNVANPGLTLSALSYAFGANTTYAISDMPVAGLSSAGSSLTLTAAPMTGSETLTFVNSPTGTGYAVTSTPPSGTATADTVDAASATGATVTLTLATPLVNGDSVDITAAGQNPASNASSQANDISVQPGNGTVKTTNAVGFGGSVSGVSVTPAFQVTTASTTYTVDFRATDAVTTGGDIYLTEPAGPTNFTTVTSIEVTDATRNWQFVATGVVLTDGSATIPLSDAIDPGDSLSISLANVTNPPAGTINDFAVGTSGDPVAATAAPYTIAANASPGVLVAVNPSSTGATATYTISNVHASGALAGGSGTLKLEAPTGTVFPNNPGFYTIMDQTTSSGSGTVSAALSGGGTNVVTFTVPNNINPRDVLTLSVTDVRNPGTSSGTDSITLVGNVTGAPPIAPTPGTPNPMPTPPISTPPVTAPAPAPTGSIGLDRSNVPVTGGTGAVELTCTGTATCSGKLTLTVKTTERHGDERRSKTRVIGTANFSVKAGKTATVHVKLNAAGRKLLRAGHGHLSAQLGIAKSSPRPAATQTKRVQLSESKPAKKSKRKHHK